MCPDSPADVKLGGIKMSGAQTQGPALTTVFKNISEYAPVWPRLEDGKLKGLKGYLFNGRKSADVVLKDGLQLNICNNRYVKTQTCFYNDKGEEITVAYTELCVGRLERQATLQAGYHFACDCARCEAPPAVDAPQV